MDKKPAAFIFGYNHYALEIITNIQDQYESVRVFNLDEETQLEDGTLLESFDLSDNWDIIKKDVDMQNSIAFCVLEDTAENIFLTISLRATFKDLRIIAIASDKESANKLKMAGANKVISLVETTSDIITNILQKPITSRILHNILYEKSDLKIAQIKITPQSHINNEQIVTIDWSRYNGIIVLSVMHKDMKSEFIYSAKAEDHIIQPDDILVVVGYEDDIAEFEKKIGSKRYVNWSHWSW